MLDKQEEYIQYLYSVIDILKQKLHNSESQCKDYSSKLRHSEKICDEKEEFILFRESQLLEFEDTINKLKQRILLLSNGKMSAGARTSRSRSGSRSRSQSRAELVSLDTLNNTRLLERINASADELFQYATGEEIMQNIGVAQHLRDVITRGSNIIKERASTEEDMAEEISKLIDDNAELRQEIFRLNVSMDGANAEIDDMATQLENIVQEKDDEFTAYQNGIANILGEHWQLDEGDDLLLELENALDYTRRELTRRVNTIDDLNAQLDEEQILTRDLSRRIILLKMTDRQRQIGLMNAPIIAPAPLPPPQPIDQIWLLLQ